ncbi:MAG TPA: hypothetical protein VFG23_07470 [Polyangia bacterium]|nr:hypothetical protein [Polyangia bacterium]
MTGRGAFDRRLVAVAAAWAALVGCDGDSNHRPTAPRATGHPTTAAAHGRPATVVDDDVDDDRGPAPATAGGGRDKVTIKLSVDAHWKAHVFWGRKDLGVAPLQIERPRGSGPLDLLIVADGALPLHTRVFTDRDSGLAVRLYAESEAPGLLGYPRSFSLPTSRRLTHNAGTFPRPRR